jgi:hypothetical protein
MRLLHYPPQEPAIDDDGRIIGIGAHTEYILSQSPAHLLELIYFPSSSLFRAATRCASAPRRADNLSSIFLTLSAVFYDLVARLRGGAAGAER